MPGPTLAERTGLTPKEPQLDEALRKAAVLEINDSVAARLGITQEQRTGYFTGNYGLEFDGRRGPDLTRVTFPGATPEGNRFIIRTFHGGKRFDDPSFEILLPADFKNPGISTQTALNEVRKLLTLPQPENPALTV